MPRRTLKKTRPRRERACLVGAGVRGEQTLWSLDDSLGELEQLARAAGAKTAARVAQHLQRPSPVYLGRGKLRELEELVHEQRIDVVIFDDELTPAQQKTLEDTLGVKVIDRSGLILDVFARRARTREGRLQIELAQGEYLLPRLAGQWSHLERLGGGIGTRGPGEAQIETDRRLVRKRLSRVRRDLERVRSQREGQRRNRARADVRVVSLVGYTNAGKSALFNRLASGGVTARDQPFSTLDPTTRRLFTPSGRDAVLTDTVGFIHKLPDTLLAAFTATLEELDVADLLLHVVDVSHPLAAQHVEVVEGILDELGLGAISRILCLNKLDLLAEHPQDALPELPEGLGGTSERTVLTSAIEGWGIDRLRAIIDRELASPAVMVSRTGALAG